MKPRERWVYEEEAINPNCENFVLPTEDICSLINDRNREVMKMSR
jgi:hypothetical protein